ncbi:MAG: MerR family transcriptional regulator [Bifidobacteriaceae bacterium]|jgi:DNA-binding transcriptional MerR regulator|nr:MerR family transcriptional regulator [Bifidobacteriaceae bacterium]
MADHLLKSGDFARLCGTTKETLRHYNAIGLLRPAVVESNGYRRYSFAQVADFMLITALSQSGRKLGQIRDYLAEPDPSALRSALADCVDQLEQEKREISRRQRALRLTLRRIDMAACAGPGPRLTIEECGPEVFVETRVEPPAGKPATAEEALDRWDANLLAAVTDHVKRCQSHGEALGYQGAYRIGREAFVAGDYWADFWLCSPALGPSKSPHLHVKPAGLYLSLTRRFELDLEQLEQAPAEFVFGAYDDLNRHVAEQGCRVAGDAYETELSVYTGAFQGTMATQLSVRVEPLPA